MRTTEQQTNRILKMRDEEIQRRKASGRRLLAIIPSAACFCMIVAFTAVALSTGLFGGFNSKAGEVAPGDDRYSEKTDPVSDGSDGQYGTSYDYSKNNDTAAASTTSKPSATATTTTTTNEPMSIPAEYRFGSCEYGGESYNSTGSKIKTSYLGEYLGQGKTHYGTGNDRVDCYCDIYSVKNIDTSFAVAVKYDGEDGYYIRYNYSHPELSLSDICGSLGFDENLITASATRTEYGTTENRLVEYSVPHELFISLFASKTLPVTGYSDYTPGSVRVTASNTDAYGTAAKLRITVYTDGYIHLNFYGISAMYKADTSAFFKALPSCPVIASEVTETFPQSTITETN